MNTGIQDTYGYNLVTVCIRTCNEIEVTHISELRCHKSIHLMNNRIEAVLPMGNEVQTDQLASEQITGQLVAG